MTDVPDFVAGARALLAAARSADLLAEVERHILLLADQPDSALGDVPPSRRRGHLDAAAVVGRYRALLADQTAARITPDNPPTSGEAADSYRPVVGLARGGRYDEQQLKAAMEPDNPAVGEPATPDDGLREQYATALHAAHREWMRPGSDAGQHLMMDALADAVMAVRDRRLEQLAAEADADSKQLAEVDERCDRYAATIARVRAVQPYTARTHGDRSEGYLLGWNAAREAAHDALEAQGADRA